MDFKWLKMYIMSVPAYRPLAEKILRKMNGREVKLIVGSFVCLFVCLFLHYQHTSINVLFSTGFTEVNKISREISGQTP